MVCNRQIKKQWGLTNNGKEGVSFPIVFKNVYALTMGIW